MPSLRQFVEQMQDRTVTARNLLLPLLSLEDDERPWTAARLRALADRRPALDPAAASALDHLLRFEVPLLAREEALESEGLPYDAFETGLVSFERLFWEARYAEALAAGEVGATDAEPGAESVCAHHPLPEGEIRRLASEQGVWDVATVAERTGATTTCGSCRLAITRILIDELSRRKATGAAR